MRVVTHTGTHTAMETVGVRACHGVKEIPQGARSRTTGERRPERASVPEDEVGPVVLGQSAGRPRAPHQLTAVGKREMQLCNAHKGAFAACLNARKGVLAFRKSWEKSKLSSCGGLACAHTDDGILQAGQPFKPFLGNSNLQQPPETCPLSPPPPPVPPPPPPQNMDLLAT